MPRELEDWFMEREFDVGVFGSATQELQEEEPLIEGNFTYPEIVGLIDQAMDLSWMSVTESDRFMRHFNAAIWELASSRDGEAMLRNLGKGKENNGFA